MMHRLSLELEPVSLWLLPLTNLAFLQNGAAVLADRGTILLASFQPTCSTPKFDAASARLLGKGTRPPKGIGREMKKPKMHWQLSDRRLTLRQRNYIKLLMCVSWWALHHLPSIPHDFCISATRRLSPPVSGIASQRLRYPHHKKT